MSWQEHLPFSIRGLRRRARTAFAHDGLSFNPADRAVLEQLAEEALQKLLGQSADDDPLARSRSILEAIGKTFPTPGLTDEYFRNLDCILRKRKRRSAPGQVVIGLSTGRCGSTSLTALLASTADSCCTHENPPLIFWQPTAEQVAFHLRRLLLLTHYFSLVFDVAHWWLNCVDQLTECIPQCKFLGLYRDADSCVESFMSIKGFGPRSWNHWVPYGSDVWLAHQWDPTYPTYEAQWASKDLDQYKRSLIRRYVTEYNRTLEHMAIRLPERTFLVKTEQLNDPGAQAALFNFVGTRGTPQKIELNVRSVLDGNRFFF